MKNEDNETEILLGNKQLLGIFFVVAVLLGAAFTGGYMVGHGSSKKASVVTSAPTASTSAEAAPSTAPGGSGGETHSVGAEQASSSADASGEQSTAQDTSTGKAETPAKRTAANRELKGGSATARTHKTEDLASTPDAAPSPAAASTAGLVPHSGQTFLQVAAVGRSEAEAVADVLHKKGFRAHAIPKPGNPKIYRVLIGPVRDTADLSATRDSLRRTGFRDVIVQRY